MSEEWIVPDETEVTTALAEKDQAAAARFAYPAGTYPGTLGAMEPQEGKFELVGKTVLHGSIILDVNGSIKREWVDLYPGIIRGDRGIVGPSLNWLHLVKALRLAGKPVPEVLEAAQRTVLSYTLVDKKSGKGKYVQKIEASG